MLKTFQWVEQVFLLTFVEYLSCSHVVLKRMWNSLSRSCMFEVNKIHYRYLTFPYYSQKNVPISETELQTVQVSVLGLLFYHPSSNWAKHLCLLNTHCRCFHSFINIGEKFIIYLSKLNSDWSMLLYKQLILI